MLLTFASKKLEKQLNSEKEIRKQYGHVARPLKNRMGALRAVANLDQVPRVPPERCHQLTGDRKGEFAVDLTGNWRLIFEPDPAAFRDDGGIDLVAVTQIKILEIKDYHG